MKKTPIALFLVFAFAVTACGTKVREAAYSDGLELTVESAVSGSDGTVISFTIVNSGTATWKVGESIQIEFQKDSSKWEEIPNDAPFVPSAVRLAPKTSLTRDYNAKQALADVPHRLAVHLENTQTGETIVIRTEFLP